MNTALISLHTLIQAFPALEMLSLREFSQRVGEAFYDKICTAFRTNLYGIYSSFHLTFKPFETYNAPEGICCKCLHPGSAKFGHLSYVFVCKCLINFAHLCRAAGFLD